MRATNQRGSAMAYFARASKSIVIRANRETIGLLAAAFAATFALAYAVHSRPAPDAASHQHQEDWTGDLADLGAPDPKTQQEPLRSADLVVPQADLALPALPAKLVARKGCDEPCVKPLPPRRDATRVASAAHVSARKDPGFLGNLNPLNHVPDMVSQPFTYAGNVVSGWIKRF